MALTFYTDYINHCLRFYARYPEPVFKSKTDELNWKACDKALKEFSDEERIMILTVYKEYDTLADNVYQLSQEKDISQDVIWTLIHKMAKKVAKNRGLI